VTAAIFSFGTGPDTFLPGTPGTPGQQCATPPCTTTVPEPQSLARISHTACRFWWRLVAIRAAVARASTRNLRESRQAPW